jgi:hypothetical protein
MRHLPPSTKDGTTQPSARPGKHSRWLLLVALLLVSPSLRADLLQDVLALKSAWASHARVTHLAPRLVERNHNRRIPISASSLDASDEGCVTIAALSVVDSSFLLRFLPQAKSPPSAHDLTPHKSIAGAVQVTRCGANREAIARLAVEMRSPRAVVEFLVAQSATPLPSLRQILPHRDPGPVRERFDHDPMPRAPPLAERARRFVQRSQREGAYDVAASTLHSGYAGTGGSILRLHEGCHRLAILAPPTPLGAARGVDLDVDLVWPRTGTIAASDHGSSADATVQVCVGRPNVIALHYSGASPRSEITVLHARWSPPGGLPRHWSHELRALVSGALLRQGHRGPLGTPVHQAMGVGGQTALPIELVPGRCYVVTAVVFRGEPAGLLLNVDVGGRVHRNHGGPGGRSTALGVCSGPYDRALAKISARGGSLAWFAAVWDTGPGPLETEIP